MHRETAKNGKPSVGLFPSAAKTAFFALATIMKSVEKTPRSNRSHAGTRINYILFRGRTRREKLHTRRLRVFLYHFRDLRYITGDRVQLLATRGTVEFDKIFL